MDLEIDTELKIYVMDPRSVLGHTKNAICIALL